MVPLSQGENFRGCKRLARDSIEFCLCKTGSVPNFFCNYDCTCEHNECISSLCRKFPQLRLSLHSLPYTTQSKALHPPRSWSFLAQWWWSWLGCSSWFSSSVGEENECTHPFSLHDRRRNRRLFCALRQRSTKRRTTKSTIALFRLILSKTTVTKRNKTRTSCLSFLIDGSEVPGSDHPRFSSPSALLKLTRECHRFPSPPLFFSFVYVFYPPSALR